MYVLFDIFFLTWAILLSQTVYVYIVFICGDIESVIREGEANFGLLEEYIGLRSFKSMCSSVDNSAVHLRHLFLFFSTLVHLLYKIASGLCSSTGMRYFC